VAFPRFMISVRDDAVSNRGARLEVEIRGNANRSTSEQYEEGSRKPARIATQGIPSRYAEQDEHEHGDQARGSREYPIAPAHGHLPIHVLADVRDLEPRRCTSRK